MTISASSTPLRRYLLLCPMCANETIVFPSNLPDDPYCKDCEEAVDLNDLKEFIDSWMDYLKDRAALLEQEGEGK